MVRPDPALTRRYRDGENIQAIAASIGRSYGYVHSRLKAAGVQMRRGRGGWPAACRRRWASVSPCGTVSAAVRHRRRGEPLDEACRAAEREYQRARRQRRREVTIGADINR
jgi:hypothetical protein